MHWYHVYLASIEGRLEKEEKTCYPHSIGICITYLLWVFMSGFSIGGVSHRLAIQDRPGRETSQSGLKNTKDEDTEEKEKSFVIETSEVPEKQPRIPTSDRIDLCNIRNALFDIDHVMAILSCIHISLKDIEETILSFSALSGEGLIKCLVELEQKILSISYDTKNIFAGDIPDCTIHLEQLDIDENDIVLSLQPFVLSFEQLEIKENGDWSAYLHSPSKDAVLLYASKKISEQMEIATAYFERMQSLIQQILFIYKNLNYKHLTLKDMESSLKELHHDLHWETLLDSLFEHTDLEGIKNISMQYL